MRRRSLQAAARWLAFLLLIAMPRPAAAIETFTGIVADLAVHDSGGTLVYFRFTDANVTKGCKNNNNPDFVDFAYFQLAGEGPKAFLAMALASKKGVTLTCKAASKPTCSIYQCILQ